MTGLVSGRLGSYSSWIRAMLTGIRSGEGEITTLFESSVPEPWELLRETIASGAASDFDGRYVDAFVGGNRFLIESLSKRYGVAAEDVICTTGATAGLSLCYQALLAPGESVLVEAPGFDLFRIVAESQGHSVACFRRTGPSFDLDLEQLEDRIGSTTKIVVLSNLHNPSGFGIGRDAALALASIAERRGLWVIIDEVYSDYAHIDAVGSSLFSLSSRFICVSSLTKIFGLSTLRCGWILAHPGAIRKIRSLGQEVDFGTSKLTHAVAASVLANPTRFVALTKSILDSARPLMEDYHSEWRRHELVEGALPPSACIAFPRLVGIDDTEVFADWAAVRHKVVVAPGEYFMAPGYVRIGFAKKPPMLERALEALTLAMRSYRDTRAEPKIARR